MCLYSSEAHLTGCTIANSIASSSGSYVRLAPADEGSHVGEAVRMRPRHTSRPLPAHTPSDPLYCHAAGKRRRDVPRQKRGAPYRLHHRQLHRLFI